MHTYTILVVEDDPVIQSLLVETLQDEGYAVMCVSNGVDALRAARGASFALVLLDLNLPVLDGYGFLREARQARLQAPVLTVSADDRGRQLTPADGVIGHVPKPFDLEALLHAVEFVVGGPPPAPLRSA